MKWQRDLRLLIVISCAFQAAWSQSQPYRLTLKEAIDKGLQANLSVLVAGTRVHESEGTTARRFSSLLPHVRTQTYANYQNRNLRAFGLSVPGLPVPDVIGPFSNYDFRIYADQSIIDLQSYHSWRASQQQVESRKHDYQDARDLIVRSIASLYLNGQEAQARIEAAQSRVRASQVLDALARAKHDAGTATGVDVLRAQVQLANDQQALLVAQNQYRQAMLGLARNIGMNPGTEFDLEPLRFQPMPTSQAEAVVASSLLARSDYLSLAIQRQSLTEQQRANRARWYPRLSVNGNYGALGRSVGDVRGIGLIQGQIDWTVFDHDRKGEAEELASRLERIDDQISDLRRGIAEEIGEALLNLESCTDQVKVAQQGKELAERELELTQDRFQSGVTNNVEVTTAQDELARAQENYILAVAGYAEAKFALARAAGGTEKNLGQYLLNP
jgi:outer membrane protein TolC